MHLDMQNYANILTRLFIKTLFKKENDFRGGCVRKRTTNCAPMNSNIGLILHFREKRTGREFFFLSREQVLF
jgi:hypothetical protein